MLTHEENERLTRVGPGTPMGTLMRRYWQPVAAKAELVERGVMPVRLYGEDLVLFLDGKGRMGLVGDRCPHRLVELKNGMATDDGVRCPYHGWTFDTTGACVAQPGEPAGSTFCQKVRIASYPVEELAGLVFAYLGPQDRPIPLLPRWDRTVWDNVYRVICCVKVPCNWLQTMENTPDPVHTEYLHGHYFRQWLDKNGVTDPRSHRLARGFTTHFIKHDYEIGRYGIDRRWLLEGQTDDNTWDVGLPLVFPNIHCTSGNGRHTFGWRVPIDDVTTCDVILRTFAPGPEVRVDQAGPVPYVHIPMYDPTKTGMDRWTGLASVSGQDVMAWASQGDIVDRTKERLADTDRGVILYRQLLRRELEKVEQGADPINVFHDPAENVQIDLPVPGDRGYAWGFAKDGSYVRGSVTAADPIPAPIRERIEDAFVEAASKRKPPEPVAV
jgi:5,5'-dehydrodivanillate O-demethylase